MTAHAGLVLAAGASTRMGSPKALLETAAGIPLARHQADLLASAGCADVLVVLGRDHTAIAARLPGLKTVHNAEWELGQFSSVQAGLRALTEFDGVFILPVDTVGVSRATVRAALDLAEKHRPIAVRPLYKGTPGKLAWISKAYAAELLRAPADSRLDLILKGKAQTLEVDDSAITNNVNTPEDWKRARPGCL